MRKPSPPPVSIADLRASVDLVRLCNASPEQAAKLGIRSASTLRRHIQEAARRWPNLVLWQEGKLVLHPWPIGFTGEHVGTTMFPPSGAVTSAPELPLAKDPVSQRREKQTEEMLRSRLKAAEEKIISLEDSYDRVAKLKQARIDPIEWMPKPAIQKSTTLLPLLFTSDFQCGEVIRPEEIDGVNEYNKDIFSERYQTLIDKTIDLARNHTGASDFPGVFYLRGGDAISGGIHEELAETDDLSAVPAVQWLVRHEAEGIRRLKDAFGRVHVISIPGNHGRTGYKRSNGYVDHSFETLLAFWLQDKFASEANITFNTPKSGDAYFKAQNWWVLMSHGDRMGSRGGQGFIGPSATIARGHAKLMANWNQTGRPVDIILTGHLHTSLKLTSGFANGAMSGYNAYARDLRATPDAAKQWLLFAHERYRISQAFEVQLSDAPRRDIEDVGFERAA